MRTAESRFRLRSCGSPGSDAAVRADAEGRFRVEAPGRRRFVLKILAPGFLLKKVVITRPQLVSRKTGRSLWNAPESSAAR